MPFKLYLDKDGKPQFDDKGVPLFMQDGATEPAAIDVNVMLDDNRAKKTAAEAAKREKDELAAKLKVFEGIAPDAARKALEIAKQAEDGKLFDAGKLDELKAKYAGEAAQKVANLEKAVVETKAAAEKEIAAKDSAIRSLLVENAFAGSAFLREKTVLPPDFAYASLGNHFAVEYDNGKPVVIAKDGKGNPIFSTSKPGEYASPEEAIKLLIEQHPQRDVLLKAPAPNGGSGSLAGGRAAGKPASLAECKTEAEKVAYLEAVGNAV